MHLALKLLELMLSARCYLLRVHRSWSCVSAGAPDGDIVRT